MSKIGLNFYLRADLVLAHLDIRKLVVDVNVDNIGDEDVNLLFDYKGKKAELTVFKVEGDEFIEVDKKVGLTSPTKHYTGKLRSGLSFSMPYLVQVDEPGIYFIEFTIDVDMGSEIKQWSDRKYHFISW